MVKTSRGLVGDDETDVFAAALRRCRPHNVHRASLIVSTQGDAELDTTLEDGARRSHGPLPASPTRRRHLERAAFTDVKWRVSGVWAVRCSYGLTCGCD